jgi:hypothetical protein
MPRLSTNCRRQAQSRRSRGILDRVYTSGLGALQLTEASHVNHGSLYKLCIPLGEHCVPTPGGICMHHDSALHVCNLPGCMDHALGSGTHISKVLEVVRLNVVSQVPQLLPLACRQQGHSRVDVEPLVITVRMQLCPGQSLSSISGMHMPELQPWAGCSRSRARYRELSAMPNIADELILSQCTPLQASWHPYWQPGSYD